MLFPQIYNSHGSHKSKDPSEMEGSFFVIGGLSIDYYKYKRFQ